jgi:NDP-sugar pyrophosphorylase family protein
MYSIVLANVWPPDAGRVVLVARKEFQLGESVEQIRTVTGADIRLVEIDYTTGGSADTVELAREHLIESAPLVIANSDQFVDADLGYFFSQLSREDLDGCILTMNDDDPKWSYAELDESGFVSRVVEKRVISQNATVGIYGFARAQLAWSAFAAMRAAGDAVNGEFYVAPAYNYLIATGHRFTVVDLGPIQDCMYGMGIPDDYEAFLLQPASNRASVAATQKIRSFVRRGG